MSLADTLVQKGGASKANQKAGPVAHWVNLLGQLLSRDFEISGLDYSCPLLNGVTANETQITCYVTNSYNCSCDLQNYNNCNDKSLT